MIVKTEYKSGNVIRNTTVDNIDKIDSGTLDDGTDFINIYRKDRLKQDDFETIVIKPMVIVYLMSNEGKTLQIYRPKK